VNNDLTISDIQTLITTMIDTGKLARPWSFRTATVVYAKDNAITVTLDGDTTPIRAQSLIGGVWADARVRVLIIPNTGNFIIGFVSLNAATRGQVIYRGSRSTSTSTTATATEISALRIDNVHVVGGRAYAFTVSGIIFDSTVGTDDGVIRLRYTTDGTQATTASTIFGGTLAKCTASSAQFVHCTLRNYYPIEDESLSVLLTFSRAGGTGTVGLVVANGFPIEITVVDMGVAPADIGVSL